PAPPRAALARRGGVLMGHGGADLLRCVSLAGRGVRLALPAHPSQHRRRLMRTLLEALERRQLLAGDGDAFVAAFDQLDDRELTTQQMAVIMAEAALDDAYAQTAWGGENYWFQSSSGEVFAVWHGGAASDVDGDGAFDWSLTNISDATGVQTPLQRNSL